MPRQRPGIRGTAATVIDRVLVRPNVLADSRQQTAECRQGTLMQLAKQRVAQDRSLAETFTLAVEFSVSRTFPPGLTGAGHHLSRSILRAVVLR